MPRIARAVVPRYLHHVTRRGSSWRQTYFYDDDYRAYLELMAAWCKRCGIEICVCKNVLRPQAPLPEASEFNGAG